MKNTIRILGIIALVAIIGFSMSACDNGGDSEGGDVYKLEWGILNKSRTEIEALIQQQGWTFETADNGSSAMSKGNVAKTSYDYCTQNFTFTSSGDATGSFEELANFSKDGISPPPGLKKLFIDNKANVPLGGIFDGGQAGAVFIYITKGSKSGSGGNNVDNGTSTSSPFRYLDITGLDDFNGASYKLGLADSVEKLLDQDLVAYRDGGYYTVGFSGNGRITYQQLNVYNTNTPWTGSGSYYVGVILDYYEWDYPRTFVTKSKKSFNSERTTLSFTDFEEVDIAVPDKPNQ